MANDVIDPHENPTAALAVLDIEQKLIGQPALDALVAALRASAFELDPEDAIVVATAASLSIDGPEAYTQGFALLEGLSDLEDRIKKHHVRFKVPLAALTNVVRDMESTASSPDGERIDDTKRALSKRLGTWKAESDRRDREEAAARQAADDTAARVAQQAKADTLKRIADAEPDEKLKQAFTQESQAVAEVQVAAPPVEMKSTAPKVFGGSIRTNWACEFVDVRELLKAWLEGRCHLPEQCLIDGLQSHMDRQAAGLQDQLDKAYPGCRGIPTHAGIARRTRK